jgi:putative endonuclease
MEGFYFVYILRSLRDGKNYAGYTKNLELRFEQHLSGEVDSTKHRRPLALIYFEACLNQQDALKRERYFKTHYGKMFIKNRLAHWYKESNSSNLISQG